MLAALTELWSYRELLLTLAGRDIKVRYKQSLLGILWALAQPLAMAFVFTVVLQYIGGIALSPSDDIPAFLIPLAGSIPWVFTQQALSAGVMSLVGNMNLVTRIYFPREVLPLAVLGVTSLDFVLGLGTLFLIMMIEGVAIPATAMWVPLIFGVQVVFTISLVLVGALANAFYRDVRHFVTLALFLGVFLAPVMYPLDKVPLDWGETAAAYPFVELISPRALYLLNPLAGIIQSYRDALVLGTCDGALLTYPAVFSAAACVAAYALFKRLEPRFAEII